MLCGILIAIIFFEIIYLLKIRLLLLNDIYSAINSINKLLKDIKNSENTQRTTILFFIIWMTLILVLAANNLFTVFSSWDAIVSWNRWAVEIFDGRFNPFGSLE